MITYAKIIDNVYLLMTGGKPSDDVYLEQEQILFILSYVTASLVEKKRLIPRRQSGVYEYRVDPILLREYKDQVVTDRKVTLPVQPFTYPDDMGVHKVLIGDCEEAIPGFSYTRAYLENFNWFPQKYYKREGLTLHLRNVGILKKCTLILTGIPDSYKDTDVFPCPPDLVDIVTEKTVAILKGEREPDYINDATDEPA